MRVMTEVESYIRQAAAERGINPDIAVEVARREGGLKNPTQQSYVRKNGIREPSYGPFQMLVGGPGTGFSRGMGNSFVSKYGVHPSDPGAWREGVNFALDQAKSQGWGAWYGAKAAGITGFKGIGKQPAGVATAPAPENIPLPKDRPGLLEMEAYTPPHPVERRELPAFEALLSGPKDLGMIAKTGRLPQQGVTPKTSRLAAFDQLGLLGKTSRLPDEAALEATRQSQPQIGLLANQYASYGAGKVAPDQVGLLGQDVAYQRMINDLNSQKQQLQAGVDPMETASPWKEPEQVQAPEVAQIEVPEVVSQPVSQPQGFSGGLLSPQEQEQYAAQHSFLSQQPDNSRFGQKAGNFAKGALGGVGGGLLGAALLGPLGGLLGAALGTSAMTGRLNEKITGFPKAPDRAGSTGKTGRISKSQLNENGRNAYNSSGQFRDAVDRGSAGLY